MSPRDLTAVPWEGLQEWLIRRRGRGRLRPPPARRLYSVLPWSLHPTRRGGTHFFLGWTYLVPGPNRDDANPPNGKRAIELEPPDYRNPYTILALHEIELGPF